MRTVELMAPAGSFEALRAAIDAGADSVYFGVGRLNMRAGAAASFSPEDIPEIVSICHAAGVRAYQTVNTAIFDEEFPALDELLERAHATGVDAIIAADVAVILRARALGLTVHISTQANITNLAAVRFYAQWADVVVLARELNLRQIAAITECIAAEGITGPSGELVRVEMFAHGALCMSYSGKCYLSLHNSGHSANRGECRQICRRRYRVTDPDTGDELDVEGRYILSPKDLCTIDFLDTFLAAGVSVLKIEGRARGAEYVARVVSAYSQALKALANGSYDTAVAAKLKEELSSVFNRGFWGGYYAGAEMVEHSRHHGSAATRRKVYVGKVINFYQRLSVAEVAVEAAPVSTGESLFWMGRTTGVVEQVLAPEDLHVSDAPVSCAAQGTTCSIRTNVTVRRGDKLYKWEEA